MHNVVINPEHLEVFEKTANKFGTGAHIVISKRYLGKKVKIITGKSKIISKKIKIDLFNSEILERKSSKFGTGCHVIIPKEYVNKKVIIIVKKLKGEKNE